MRRARSYQFSVQLLDRRMAQSVHFALMASRNEMHCAIGASQIAQAQAQCRISIAGASN